MKLAIALIATMSALVLGLLIASAKTSYDTRMRDFTQLSADIILLDRVFAHYGPETKDARALLRHSVGAMLDRMSTTDSNRAMRLGPWGANAEIIYEKTQELSPQSEAQRSLQGQALKVITDLGNTRWLLFTQSGGAIPTSFLAVLTFWLTIIFASFGLFAPRNATVIATLIVCALSVSGAIFVILEFDRSFNGSCRSHQMPPCRRPWTISVSKTTEGHRAQTLEGIVSKRADAPYAPGNRGYGSKSNACTARNSWWAAGPIPKARGLITARCCSPTTLSRVHWVRPELVAEVKFLTWPDDNLLRQVVYEGLREDKPAAEVRRPVPHP